MLPGSGSGPKLSQNSGFESKFNVFGSTTLLEEQKNNMGFQDNFKIMSLGKRLPSGKQYSEPAGKKPQRLNPYLMWPLAAFLSGCGWWLQGWVVVWISPIYVTDWLDLLLGGAPLPTRAQLHGEERERGVLYQGMRWCITLHPKYLKNCQFYTTFLIFFANSS